MVDAIRIPQLVAYAVSCQNNDIMIIMITTAQSTTMTISLGYRLTQLHVHVTKSIIMYLATVMSLYNQRPTPSPNGGPYDSPSASG